MKTFVGLGGASGIAKLVKTPVGAIVAGTIVTGAGLSYGAKQYDRWKGEGSNVSKYFTLSHYLGGGKPERPSYTAKPGTRDRIQYGSQLDVMTRRLQTSLSSNIKRRKC